MRTCIHIKPDGIKCGSPALRHHTMCYFHFQSMRRDKRRMRMSGHWGTNRDTGIELPMPDSPHSIVVALYEIQTALIDRRIEAKDATALFYSLQLCLQAQAMLPRQDSSEFEPVFECPDLDRDLDRQRSRGERPAREACDACPKQNECVSPDDCDNLPEPDSPGAPFEPSVGSSGVAPSSDPPIFGSSDAPCHPERSAVVSRAVEGPSVSSPEATTLDPTSAALRTLISNRAILKDLAPKFPHLAEFARLVK